MSTTTTLLKLVDDLKFYARAQPSEGFNDPSDYERVVASAIRKHNSSYSATSSSCTVPEKEHDVVVTFSWSRLCVIRASRFAADPNTNQQGFGTDRNTPYYKCMDLSKLLSKQYAEDCASLGLTIYAGAGAAVVSEVTCENLDLSAQTPVEMAAYPPAIALSTATTTVNGDGTVIVAWLQDRYGNFASYTLVHATGNTALYQEWNNNPAVSVPPRISDGATVVGCFNTQDIKAVKVTDLTVTSGTKNRFLLVCESKSGKYTYSNEMVLTQP